jgi:histidine triad (HIT) family protein
MEIVMSCIFCNTNKPEFKNERLVFENKTIVIFLSNKPTNPGHVLIIPKNHYPTLWDTPDDVLHELILYVKKFSIIVKEVMNADGINIGVNNGKAAGQEVFHLHFHIIPRFKDDGLKLLPASDISEELLLKYTKLIKEKFQET